MNDQRDGLMPPDRTEQPRRWEAIVVCGLLLAAVWVVFGQTVGHPFINLDDDICVYENPWVTGGLRAKGIWWAFTHRYAGVWAPVVWMSHMLDWRLYGAWAGGHHLTNVLLHAGATLVLFLALRRMTGRVWPSAMAAALFAIHPLRVESVAWVTERKDVLSGLFFMLALWAYAGYARGGAPAVVHAPPQPTKQAAGKRRRAGETPRRSVGSSRAPRSYLPGLAVIVCFALGLMSKPAVVTLPFILLLLDYWPLGRMTNGKPGAAIAKSPLLIIEKLPLLALAAVSCMVTLWAQGSALTANQLYSFSWRMCHIPIAYVGYLFQFLHPVDLAVPYPRPGELPFWQVSGAALLLAAITVAFVAARRRYAYLLIGWLWYLGMLLPAIGLVQFGVQATADRFTYLPQIGLCIALAWSLADIWQAAARRDAEGGEGAKSATPTRTAPFSLRRNPGQSPAYRCWALNATAVLAVAALTASAWRQTTFWSDSETLWTHSINSSSRNALAHLYLGNEFCGQGRWNEAVAEYESAVAIDPRCADALNNEGRALAALGRHEEAVGQYRKALASNPKCAEAYHNLAATLASRGRWDEAIAQYAEAVRLRPNQAEWHSRYGEALAAAGRTDEAINQYQEALNLEPGLSDAENGLAGSLADIGRTDDAIRHYRAALQMEPECFEARHGLGVALAKAGRTGEAISQYREALKLKPGDADSHNNLGLALASSGRAAEAMAEFGEAIRLKPDCVQALANLAVGYAQAGKRAEAITTARRALQLAERQKDEPLAAALRTRLAEFEAGKSGR